MSKESRALNRKIGQLSQMLSGISTDIQGLTNSYNDANDASDYLAKAHTACISSVVSMEKSFTFGNGETADNGKIDELADIIASQQIEVERIKGKISGKKTRLQVIQGKIDADLNAAKAELAALANDDESGD